MKSSKHLSRLFRREASLAVRFFPRRLVGEDGALVAALKRERERRGE
jgi:hypothetical protein